MVPERSHSLLQYLRDAAETSRLRQAPDQDLVDAFVSARSEAAFDTLVRRHGPMVLGLCRRVLGNDQDAEDAFQATFLVFARKAAGLRRDAPVGNWLYGVACRTSRKARAARARRAARERAVSTPAPPGPLAELTVQEAQRVVEEELERLPEKFRSPLVLCCLEGLARDEAARQLGWKVGVLKSRLEQARERLRSRLSRRGLSLPAALLSVGLLGTAAQAGVPAALTASTRAAAGAVAAGGSGAGVVSAQVLNLTEGVVRMMFWAKLKVLAAAVLAVVTVGAAAALPLLAGGRPGGEGAGGRPAPAARAGLPRAAGEGGQDPVRALKPESLERWSGGEVVFTGTLDTVRGGPMGLSNPPLYNHTLELTVKDVLRGDVKRAAKFTGFHSVRQAAEPTFPRGKTCVVAANKVRGRWLVVAVREAAEDELAQAKMACSVPVGWRLEGGRLLSPWAGLGKKAWPAGAGAGGKVRIVCAATGRPALQAGAGVTFTVEAVPPKKSIQWTNPDGDGEYRITVRNTTGKPVSVPALLSDGKKVLWDESLAIVCQGKTYTAPGARGVKLPPRPTVLRAGESVSTVVNALALEGPQWPRGGYRIEFQFALGEKAATQSFYYMSRHHDGVRKQLTGGKPAGDDK